MKTRMQMLIHLFLLLSVSGILNGGQTKVSEAAELASFAQDIYRQEGINLPRSTFELKQLETWGRVFIIRINSQEATLSQDLLQGFVAGGAVSQHARSPLDQVVLMVELESDNNKLMILRSTGMCCEELYNNRLTPDMFTERCLRMDFDN